MMTGCLVSSVMRWPTTRAMMSFGPPGGNGTISLIGLLGKSCAATGVASSRSDNAAAIAPKILIEPPQSVFASRKRVKQRIQRRCLCVCRVQSCTANFSERVASSCRSGQQFVGLREPDRLLGDQIAPHPMVVADD